MELRVLLPTEVLVHETVTKIIAEASNGEFCLLPRHVDFVAALVPGILAYVPAGGDVRYVAVDYGTLVKCGHDVMVSVKDGVCGTDLATLQQTIEDRFLVLDEQARKVRTALARLEAGTLRRFRELQIRSHGPE